MHHTCLNRQPSGWLRREWPALLVLALLFLPATPAPACNVPVFRYALENWQPERYEALVVSRGPLSTAGQAALAVLEKARNDNGANLEITQVDTAGPVPPEIQQLLTANQALPCLLVRNGHDPEGGLAWSAPLSESSARQLIDSPARRQLVQALLAGKSCVWLLVESGDKSQDDAAAALLEKELKGLETELELPVPAVDDPQIQAGIPLQLALSFLRVSRRDAAEAAFVAQLLAGETEAAKSGKPVAFPVFGRGRALPPMYGEELGPDLLTEACKFIIGGCSCAVKELNPGKDLLLMASWDAALGGTVQPEERQPIPQPVIGAGVGSVTGAVPPAAAASIAPPPGSRRMLLIGIGLVAIMALFSGVSLLSRKH